MRKPLDSKEHVLSFLHDRLEGEEKNLGKYFSKQGWWKTYTYHIRQKPHQNPAKVNPRAPLG